jgi:WD40 repeat protein
MTNSSSSLPLPTLICRVAAALFLVAGPPASAGIFGPNKNDVAVKVAELPSPDSKIYPLGLDFGVDGGRIAVESQSGKIHIWDWRNKRFEKTIELPNGGNALGTTNPVLYSSDGRFLAACEVSGAGDVVVRIWDAASWSIAKDISASTGIESRGSCKGMSFTPGGQYFVRTAETSGLPGNNLIVSSARISGQPSRYSKASEATQPPQLALNPAPVSR